MKQLQFLFHAITDDKYRNEIMQKIRIFSAVQKVSSQLVPKSTRTLVNSYPFLVNSYLTFGQLVPIPSQLVPESKNGAG